MLTPSTHAATPVTRGSAASHVASEVAPAPQPGRTGAPVAERGPGTPTQGGAEGPTLEPGEPFQFFAPSSVWNAPLPPEAPLDLDSEAIVNALAAEIAYGEQTGKSPQTSIDTTSYSVPIYRCRPNSPPCRWP